MSVGRRRRQASGTIVGRRRAGARWRAARPATPALLLLAPLLLLLVAAPAQAHSSLTSTSPVAGARLARPPASVAVHFDGAVTVVSGSMLVLDGGGRRIRTDRAQHPAGNPTTVQVDLPPGLGSGSYSVIWRVVSSDGHPLAGTFAFGVGVPAGPVPQRPTPDPVTKALHALFTVAGYAGAVLLLGAGFFLLVIWPDGAHEQRPRAVLRAGWWACAGASAALLVLQGPFDSGAGPADVVDLALVGQTLATRPGILLAVRLFVLGLAVAAGPWPGSDPPAALRRNAAVLGAVLLATFSLAGHSGEGPLAPLAVGSDMLHLAAAGVWLGGLATLAACLAALTGATRSGAALEAGQVWSRWSGCAAGAVCVLALTGAFQAWRQVPAPAALPGTGYGRTLLVKLGLVALLLVLGDQARRHVHRARTDARAATRLRRSLAVELAVGLAVVCVTTALVGQQPPGQAERAPSGARDAPGWSRTCAQCV